MLNLPRKTLFPLITSALASVGCLIIPGSQAQTVQPQNFPEYMDFQGRYLAILSDADMVASAYMNGDLGPRSPEMQDELSLIPLNNGLPGEPHRIPVSNAATSWPSILALSEDGRFAYVAETDGPVLEADFSR